MFHILLVDDSPLLQAVTVRMVNSALEDKFTKSGSGGSGVSIGAAVSVAADGPSAVNIFERHYHESLRVVILMDVHMPGEYDGLEATARIRQHEKAMIPAERPPSFIVGYTSDIAPENVNRCMRAGMDAVIKKPCAALTTQLQRLLF